MRLFYFVLSCLGSHKQPRGVYGARAGKENIFLTYKQAMKIFSLPSTCKEVWQITTDFNIEVIR